MSWGSVSFQFVTSFAGPWLRSREARTDTTSVAGGAPSAMVGISANLLRMPSVVEP